MTRHLLILGLAFLAGSCVTDPIPLGALNASVDNDGEPDGSEMCGNGLLEDGEACDDGQTDNCGDCNADCTGPGSAPVCGDGDVCVGVEACDDGFASDCGSCNADCTGPGTGSTCGDGVVCLETEVCEEDDGSACGGCSLDCSSPGLGPECIFEDGTFDPRYVYLRGTISAGDCEVEVVSSVVHPNRPFAGLRCTVYQHFIRPSDGRLLYVNRSDGRLHVFHCDGCPEWSGRGEFPQDVFANDDQVSTPYCEVATYDIEAYIVGPDDSLYYKCQSGWHSDTGYSVGIYDREPAYVSYDGVGLSDVAGEPAIVNLQTGSWVRVSSLANRAVLHGRSKVPGGFVAAVEGESASDPPELWEIEADASATRTVVYAPEPQSIALADQSILDADGNLYQTGRSGLHDVVVIRPADGSDSTVIYTEAANPTVKMHNSRLFTGP